MKKLRVFAHRSEAQLAKSLLVSNGIRAEMLEDHGNFSVVVGEDKWNEARRIIDEVLVKDMILVKPAGRPDHFKKAILYALGAPILIPVVFNYLSLYHAWKYWENSHKETEDMLKVAFIVALNIPTYYIVKYAFTMIGDLTSMMGLPSEGVEF